MKQTTDFMNAHRQHVEESLTTRLMKPADFGSHVSGAPVRIASIAVRVTEAIPEELPREGKDCPITALATALGVILVEEKERVLWPEERIGLSSHEAVREMYIDKLRGPEFVRVEALKRVELPILIKANAKFAKGDFIGPPTIESYTVPA